MAHTTDYSYDPSTLAVMKRLLRKAYGANSEAELYKSFTTSNLGAYGINLETLMYSVYPVPTPLLDRWSRSNAMEGSFSGGPTATWKMYTGINTGNVDGAIPTTGAINTTAISYTSVEKTANFVMWGQKDSVSQGDINVSQGFEDVLAFSVMATNQAARIYEEKATIGGNATQALAAAGSIAVAADGDGAFTGTLYVNIVPLTALGWNARTHVGTTNTAIVTDKWHGPKGTEANTGSITGKAAKATWTRVPGAAAYAVYAGTTTGDANLYLQAITTVTEWSFNAASVTTSGRQLLSGITVTDCSINKIDNVPIEYDGLFPLLLTPGNNAYIKDMLARPLTSESNAVKEINDALEYLYNYRLIGGTLVLCNSQEQRTISNMVRGSLAPGYRTELADGSKGVVAGGMVSNYVNPWTGNLTPGLTDQMEIVSHPYMPPGTLMILSERLPYPRNMVPAPFRKKMLRDYTATMFAKNDLSYPHGVFAHGVFQVYCPFTCAVITNIAPPA